MSARRLNCSGFHKKGHKPRRKNFGLYLQKPGDNPSLACDCMTLYSISHRPRRRFPTDFFFCPFDPRLD